MSTQFCDFGIVHYGGDGRLRSDSEICKFDRDFTNDGRRGCGESGRIRDGSRDKSDGRIEVGHGVRLI